MAFLQVIRLQMLEFLSLPRFSFSLSEKGGKREEENAMEKEALITPFFGCVYV